MKRADIPAKASIFSLLQENLQLSKTGKAENLEPFAFYTDGGTYQDSNKYFINNIFSRSGVCHSTRVPKNANVQFYLGRKIEVSDPNQVLPAQHKVKGQANEICLPYEKFVKDTDEEESFKLIRHLTMHNMGSGYTCFVKSFCVFVSDREIKPAKSPVIKYFEDILTEADFKTKNIPVANYTKCSDGISNVAYEIDLSNTALL